MKGLTSYKGIRIVLANSSYRVNNGNLTFFVGTLEDALDTVDTLLALPSYVTTDIVLFIQQGNKISFWEVGHTYKDLLALKEIIANPPNQLGKYYEAGLDKATEFKNNLKRDPSKPIETIFHNYYYNVSVTRSNMRVSILGIQEIIPIVEAEHVFWLIANIPNMNPKNLHSKLALYLYLKYLYDNSEEISKSL